MANPRKILIANRGEIALRIMRTCREMRIPTVAVFAEADRRSPHVLFADERCALDAATPRQAYLDKAQLVAAARAVGADAVHPGYGFLSENADFAEACAEAGLIFIGPPPASIRAMGDKVEARRRMQAAGVPVVPGSAVLGDDSAEVSREAERIGYPIFVKAAAGGGGIGMRVAERPEDLSAAVETCRRAAQASFGNPDVYLERYLENPRHIEMQVLADAHDSVLAIGERECSIQRRHQKLLEESPAVGLPPELWEAMAAAAVRAARAVGYRNAGTVEFMVSGGEFYFLEMNTRLQVEHPVTEMVRGMDLVREQIRIAAGDSLPAELPSGRGHAIEFRINAEDPLRNFMPAPRRVRRYAPPTGPGVRVDSGIGPRQEISPHFDSLLAKLIVWGADREQALGRGRRALQEFVLSGPATTIPFHRAVLEEPDFVEGRITTHFIEDHPEVMERTRLFATESSPLEPLYGNQELAAAIGAVVGLSEERG